jgi:hypothetical protein
VVQGDLVLVGAVSRELLVAALDAGDGDVRWQFQPTK